jgi:CelD/BcsL family acetyltransferase involved in cellulose biosynthesis
MKISLISASELDAGLIERWKQIQSSDVSLRSPYYSPGFTRLVAGSGQAVRVAVIESEGIIAGFFPHQQASFGRLKNVGGGLNDYHGLIALPSLDVQASALLKACKGTYFGFNHLPLTQAVFAPFVHLQSVSPVLELAGGWEAYVKRLGVAQNTRSPGILVTLRASLKRLERDLGPVRFEMHEKNQHVLEELMRLKSEQRAKTVGAAGDPFSVSWIRQLMFSALETGGLDFGASMSTLHAGDKLIAVHYGLRAGSTLHSWFPVFEPAYSYYQPGLILLKKIAETGWDAGLSLIDLGRGTATYKMRFKTAVVPLGQGAVSRPALLGQTIMAAQGMKAAIKSNSKIGQLRQWMTAPKE